MTNRRPRTPATTPILPGVGAYPDIHAFTDNPGQVEQDVINKLNAGSLLVHALYTHPQARELFSSPYMTKSLLNAYMAAAKAWGL